MFLPPSKNIPADQRRLLELYSDLPEQERETLVSFAEFLRQRAAQNDLEQGSSPANIPEPLAIERPDGESVVGAMKRLSKSYFMLDRSLVLDQATTLMTAHIIHGRPAKSVIEELEALFELRYRELTEPKT